jgi:hypothetical protein
MSLVSGFPAPLTAFAIIDFSENRVYFFFSFVSWLFIERKRTCIGNRSDILCTTSQPSCFIDFITFVFVVWE